MERKGYNKKNRSRILTLLFVLTLITAGIVVSAAGYSHRKGQHVEKDMPMTEESAEDEENSMAVESIVPVEETIKETIVETVEETIKEQIESAVGIETMTQTEIVQMTEQQLTKQRAADRLSHMTTEEKVAQMFFITPELLTGAENVTSTDDVMRAALDRYPVGGLVYFAKNLQTPEQTRDMLQGVQEYAMQTQGFPIFLGVDEEGGRVLRVGSNSAFGVVKTKAMGILAAQQDTQVIRNAAAVIGAYLRDLGFNVDFAPDADVLTNESNQVIGDRSFGSDPYGVADMAWAYSEGLHQYDMLACYKHFPGHGGTVEDSHSGYAYSYKTIEELKEMELVPFQDGCDKGIDLIMVSHVSTPQVTGSDVPATLSRELVTDLLREKMGFEGIIITDSMNMGAVSEHYSPGDAAVMAVQAGCDMLLMSDSFEPSYSAVLDAVKDGRIRMEDIDDSVTRILETKLGMQ